MAEYIKREALQAALQRKKAGAANARYTDGWNDCLMRCKSMVSCFPAADVAPVRHGRWNVVEGRRLDNAICSNCGRHFQAYYEGYSFCPNCGAKMMGETHESEKQL